MTRHKHEWLAAVAIALLEARATLDGLRDHSPALLAQIDAAIEEAQRLKLRAARP